MSRRNIIFIQHHSHLPPRDEKIKTLLPYIKHNFMTYVETLRIPAFEPAPGGKNSAVPLKTRAKLVLKAVKFDLVYVRNIFDLTLLRSLRLANDNLVLEISQPRGSALDLFAQSSEKRRRRMRKIVEKAAAVSKRVLVEGDHQVKMLKKWNNNIHVCPPVFPNTTAPPGKSGAAEEVRAVGFAGTGADLHALKSIEGALQKICEKFPEIHAIGKSEHFFRLEPPVKFVYRKIDPKAGCDIFSDTDIWIQPAKRQTADFYGNSTFVLHALAARKPCIVWRTEIDGTIFRDGEDMFIVSCEDEFVEKLSLLIENRKLRKNMAEKGFERAKKHFSPDVAADFYIDAFKKILYKP